MRFWATEDAVLRELYGVVGIDPAAARARRAPAARTAVGELQRLARHLKRSGRLRAGASEREALDALMVLTSYETFCELRLAGRAERQIVALLQRSARSLLLG